MTVQLEVGKAYRTRGGERVVIAGNGGSKTFAYRGLIDGVFRTFNDNGKHCRQNECPNDIIAEWTAEPDPEIDWGGVLQRLDPDDIDKEWVDVIVVWHDDELAVGWVEDGGLIHAESWAFADWQFRNKPPEPKRIKGWVNIYHPMSTHQPFWCSAYRDQNAANSNADGGRIACVEIDVPEGHGLND